MARKTKEKTEKTDEELWAEKIRDKLNERFDEKPDTAFHAETQVEIPYGIKIKEFKIEDISKNKERLRLTHDFENKSERERMFTVDLLIYERKNDGKKKNKDGKEENVIIIPRVVVEAKYKNADTHGIITYGEKSAMHRALIPHLRYGMMVGAKAHLTGKYFEHGNEFDFMFAFKGEKPTKEEMDKFFDVVTSQIRSSQNQETLLELWNKKKSNIYCVNKTLEIEPPKRSDDNAS